MLGPSPRVNQDITQPSPGAWPARCRPAGAPRSTPSAPTSRPARRSACAGPSTKTPSRPASATAAASSPGPSRALGETILRRLFSHLLDSGVARTRAWRRPLAVAARAAAPRARSLHPRAGARCPKQRPRRRSRSTPSGASPAPGPPARPGGTRSTGTSTRRSTRAAASGRSRIFSPRPAGPSCARRAPRILDLDPWEETYLYLRSKFRLLPRDLNLHPNQIQCYLP